VFSSVGSVVVVVGRWRIVRDRAAPLISQQPRSWGVSLCLTEPDCEPPTFPETASPSSVAVKSHKFLALAVILPSSDFSWCHDICSRAANVGLRKERESPHDWRESAAGLSAIAAFIAHAPRCALRVSGNPPRPDVDVDGCTVHSATTRISAEPRRFADGRADPGTAVGTVLEAAHNSTAYVLGEVAWYDCVDADRVALPKRHPAPQQWNRPSGLPCNYIKRF